jgi:hypothetical protein
LEIFDEVILVDACGVAADTHDAISRTSIIRLDRAYCLRSNKSGENE